MKTYKWNKFLEGKALNVTKHSKHLYRLNFIYYIGAKLTKGKVNHSPLKRVGLRREEQGQLVD